LQVLQLGVQHFGAFLQKLLRAFLQWSTQQASQPQVGAQAVSQATTLQTGLQTIRVQVTFSQTGTHFVTQRVAW
jgi:hypothetical protein